MSMGTFIGGILDFDPEDYEKGEVTPLMTFDEIQNILKQNDLPTYEENVEEEEEGWFEGTGDYANLKIVCSTMSQMDFLNILSIESEQIFLPVAFDKPLAIPENLLEEEFFYCSSLISSVQIMKELKQLADVMKMNLDDAPDYLEDEDEFNSYCDKLADESDFSLDIEITDPDDLTDEVLIAYIDNHMGIDLTEFEEDMVQDYLKTLRQEMRENTDKEKLKYRSIVDANLLYQATKMAVEKRFTITFG